MRERRSSPVLADQSFVVTVLEQFLVNSLVYDSTAVQHDDQVGVPHRRNAMGDDHDGGPFSQCGQGLLDRVFAGGVERAGGLVQEIDGGIDQDRPGEADPLLLAAGQPSADLPQVRVVPVGQTLNELVSEGQPARVDDFASGRLGSSIADVLGNRSRREHFRLRDEAEMRSPSLCAEFRGWIASGEHGPVARLDDLEKHLEDRGLAGPRDADNGHLRTRGKDKTDVVQGPFCACRVGEADVSQLDLALGRGRRAGTLVHPFGQRKNLHELLGATQGDVEGGDQGSDPLGVSNDHDGEVGEGGGGPCRQLVGGNQVHDIGGTEDQEREREEPKGSEDGELQQFLAQKEPLDLVRVRREHPVLSHDLVEGVDDVPSPERLARVATGLRLRLLEAFPEASKNGREREDGDGHHDRDAHGDEGQSRAYENCARDTSNQAKNRTQEAWNRIADEGSQLRRVGDDPRLQFAARLLVDHFVAVIHDAGEHASSDVPYVVGPRPGNGVQRRHVDHLANGEHQDENESEVGDGPKHRHIGDDFVEPRVDDEPGCQRSDGHHSRRQVGDRQVPAVGSDKGPERGEEATKVRGKLLARVVLLLWILIGVLGTPVGRGFSRCHSGLH